MLMKRENITEARIIMAFVGILGIPVLGILLIPFWLHAPTITLWVVLSWAAFWLGPIFLRIGFTFCWSLLRIWWIGTFGKESNGK